jgi:trimethylamine---corrinoid protein Co-methyltransferase
VSDFQAGHEKTMTGLMAMLAGSSSIYGPGMLEAGVTFDLAQLVMDNEVIAMTRYARAGIPVDDSTTSLDEILEVGPAGNFLERPSTLKGMSGLSSPKFMDRQVRESWEGIGSPEMYAQAATAAREILATHKVDPLPADVASEVHRLVEEADRELAGDGVMS